MYEVLACLVSISFGLFLEKGDPFFLFLETFLFIIVIWVFVCYNKRNICFCPINKLVLCMKFVFYWLHFIGQNCTLQVMLLLLPFAGVLPWTYCADRGIKNFPVSDVHL